MIKYIKKYIGVVFLLGAVVVMFWLFSGDSEDEIRSTNNGLARVTVMSLAPQSQVVPVVSHGNVSARWQSVLTSDVSGRVTHVSPALFIGGEFKQGDVLLRIDNGPYRVALAEAESALATAQQLLLQEQQQASRAEQDWRLSGLSGQPTDLLLRKPQLHAAKSQLEAAQITLQRARHNLQNTNITAPYDGATISRRISLGDYLATEAEIAEIYSREHLQVNLPVIQSQLAYLSSGEVSITLKSADGRQQWSAHAVRQSKVIDSKSRQATVVAELLGNIADEDLPLLGQFVVAELTAAKQDNVVQVPRDCISGDSRIWYVDEQSTLQLFENKYLSQSEQYVYLQAINQDSAKELEELEESEELNELKVVCYPSKTFYAGMSVALQRKDNE